MEEKKKELKELDNRWGKFSVSRSFIICEPEYVRYLMGQMLIIRAEFLLQKDAVEYIAISDMFEELEGNNMPLGKDVPEYKIILGDNNKFKAEKIDRRNNDCNCEK